jgi:hypothetical protein
VGVSTATGASRGIGLGIGLLGLIGASPAALAFEPFDPGQVFWAPGSCTATCAVFEVTGGGDQQGATPLAPTQGAPGQMAWSEDRSTAYLSELALDRILALTTGGGSSVFATGINGVTGLLRARDGRLLAASYHSRAIYDVSAGGSVAGATPFATGLGRPRNLVQLPDGRILVADQSGHRVVDVTAGGDFTGAPGFASGFPDGPYDVVADDQGHLFASTFAGIYEIGAGGSVAAAAPFAWGRDFTGLAIDGEGRLLASVLSTGLVLDVSVGGDFSASGPWAWNLPGFADTTLDVVPEDVTDCSDGLDNDGDGFADGADPGCDGLDDVSERSNAFACDDGVDNDGDGLADHDPDPDEGDPGCLHPSAGSESPACQDGLDNDGDGFIDFDGGASVLGPEAPGLTAPDPGCGGLPWLGWEGGIECGLGFELVFALPPLLLLRRRSR